MSEKYYRLEACGIKESLSEGTIFGNCDEVSPSKEADEIGLVKFVPVTLPRVGWLPIGDKKEFEDGTLFKNDDNLVTSTRYPLDTYYLPPLPVLDGVKELTVFKDQLISSMSHDAEVSLKALQNATARISELEESLRKAEESNKQSPAWQELAKFEGYVPAGWLVVAEDGCSMWTVTPDSAAFWISRKFKWVIPPPRKDNRSKIAELEREKEKLDANLQAAKDAIQAHQMNIDETSEVLGDICAELDKLKEGK